MTMRCSYAIWIILMSAFLASCSRGEGVECSIRLGPETTFIQSWANWDAEKLVIYDGIDVEWRHAEEFEGTRVEWSGPQKLISSAIGEISDQALVLSHEERCRWMRNLSYRPSAVVYAPHLQRLEHRGQGDFNMDFLQRTGAFRVEAHASSGMLYIAAQVDTLSVLLHAGPTGAVVEGSGSVFEGYASGLAGLDAGSFAAQYAFINQSGVRLLRFQAAKYAYIGLHGPGDVHGIGGEPIDWTTSQTSTGELIWTP